MGADLNTVLYKILLPAYAGMIPGAMFRLSSCYNFN